MPSVKQYKNKTIIKVDKLEGVVDKKVLWQPVTFFINVGEKIGIIGANGSGKTTLVKKIISRQEENLYVSAYTKIGYFDQKLAVLNQRKTVLENALQESIQSEHKVRAILDQFGFTNNDLQKKIEVLSGGEKVKVALVKLLVGDYNTLLLDEPTNHLDIYNIEVLEELLKDYSGTVILISHDQRFMEKIVSKIIAIENKQINVFNGTLDAFYNRVDVKNSKNDDAEKLMLIDMELTKILSQLSITPTDELEEKYQSLLKLKNNIKNLK